MRLAQRCAGWALLTAGTVGLTVPAVMQMLPASVQASSAPKAAPKVDEGAVGSARLAEIRVELAWLTDPLTFPYELAAYVNGNTMEVGGVVPTDQHRQRAILLAQSQCSLPVVDKVRITPSVTVVPVRDSNTNLSRAATQALAKAFNHFPGRFQVGADTHGQVTVSGEVPTCEDKLTISRRLAQLTGCSSVVNQLVVTPVVHNSKTFTPITSDGKLVLLGEPKSLIPSFTTASLAAVATAPAKPATTVAATKPTPKTTTPAPLSTTVAQAPKPVPAPAAQPASNTGIVLASATTPAAPTKPVSSTLAPEVVAKLRQKVVQTCGVKATDVSLKSQSKDDLVLHFTVHKESDGQELGLKVMNLPELAPYKVDLQVDVK